MESIFHRIGLKNQLRIKRENRVVFRILTSPIIRHAIAEAAARYFQTQESILDLTLINILFPLAKCGRFHVANDRGAYDMVYRSYKIKR
jgi:hypothetical protein